MTDDSGNPTPTDPGDAELISQALAAIPAMLRYVPASGTLLACLPLSGSVQSDSILTVDSEAELSKAGSQITPFLRTALAAGADRMITVMGVTYPNALITAQPGFELAKQISGRLSEYGMDEVPIMVAGGFTSPSGSWAQLGHLDPSLPIQEQSHLFTEQIPDWRDHLAAISLAARGQVIADSQSQVGNYWTAQVEPPVGSGGHPGDRPSQINTPEQALAGFTELVETLAHQYQPTADMDQLGDVAIGLEHMLKDEPLMGFMLTPALTAHPDQAYKILSLLVPITRGVGRSHLLDWATIAALVSGQQRSAEVALTAVAQSKAADGPTELSAMLYGGLASGTWNQTLPIILDSGIGEMRQLPESYDVTGIVSGCAAAAVRCGHQTQTQTEADN